jgi:putative phosphoesterase
LLAEASLIVHAGDFTTAAALAELQAIGPPVAAVHGNMDDAELRDGLPDCVVAEGEGIRIGVVHDGGPATGRAERLAKRFPGCHAVVYGHSHLPEVARSGDVWVLNPGSPTERRRAPSHTMIVIRAGKPELVEL